MHVRGLGWAMMGGLLTGLAPALVRAQGDDPCARANVDESVRSRCARNLYGERKYVAAARHYERLWLDTGDPKYLYNAAAAREAGGHMAAAQAHWTRYHTSSGVSAAERAEVQLRLEEMRARLVAVTVTVSPGDVLGPAATFWCERGTSRAHEYFEIPAQLVANTTSDSFTLHLEPGTWELRLSPASAFQTYATTRTSVLVSDSPVDLPMALEPSVGQDGATNFDSERVARRLTLGMGGGSGGLALLGIVVVAASAKSGDETSDDARRSLQRVGWGGGMIGAAIGLGAAAGLETLAPTRRRHHIQLGVGAGVAAIGLVSQIAVTALHNDALEGCPTPCHIGQDRRAARGATAALVGVGASLMAGAGVSHLLRVWLPRRREQSRIEAGALMHVHTIGLVVHGSF